MQAKILKRLTMNFQPPPPPKKKVLAGYPAGIEPGCGGGGSWIAQGALHNTGQKINLLTGIPELLDPEPVSFA